MLSRALSLATVTLLIGCLAASPVRAQNLEAGKSPSQIFSGTCAACHKSPRGLLKSVPAGSLPGYLRQHYTTSSEMASLLSAFLISNGATDTRYVGSRPTQQPKDAQQPQQLDRFGRPLRPSSAPPQEAARPDALPQQAARPDADGIAPQAEPGRQGRNAKRLPRPGEQPGAEGQPATEAAIDRGPDGRKSAKQKLGKKGRGDEPAKPDVARDEPRNEPKDDTPKSETARQDGSGPEGSKPSGEGKPESAKADPSAGGEAPALRPDPVPAVTPAPPAVSAAAPASEPAAAAASSPPPVASVPPPSVTASVPTPEPVAPAGPPAPPISQ